jgi:hypothetical protein
MVMPKRIPEETKQRAIRLVLDHLVDSARVPFRLKSQDGIDDYVQPGDA